MSIPALFNIGVLLLLVMFIYSILGMTLFQDLPRSGSINEIVNFETFANSMLLLFRLTTAAGWNDVLQQIMASGTQPAFVCILYMSSYILVTFIVIVNMYVAVILENFTEAQEQELEGVTDDHIDMFYEEWSKYDPSATQFISLEQLPDFLDCLKSPLRIPKPNAVKIAALNLPITSENKLHCLDILRGISCVIVGNVEETDPLRKLQVQITTRTLKRFPLRNNMQAFTTTLMIRKEVKAAMTIQRAFRKWQVRRRLLTAHKRKGWSLLYFVAFIVVGTFFTLNLFIGVIIDNFNTVHKRSRKEGALVMLLTEDQRHLYGALKRVSKVKPTKMIPAPKNAVLLFFYKVVHHKYFEPLTIILIVLNMLLMTSEHYGQSDSFIQAQDMVLNLFLALLLNFFAGDIFTTDTSESVPLKIKFQRFLSMLKLRNKPIPSAAKVEPSPQNRPLEQNNIQLSGGSKTTDSMEGQTFRPLRHALFKLVKHSVFEGIVLFIILVSTITLTVDDKYTKKNPKIQQVLRSLDNFYLAFFNLEMVLKISGLGVTSYFTNVWTLLDFLLVVIGWLGVLSSSIKSLRSLRSFRTLRALRPLRAISRWEGMRLVVNALITSIPSISNVMLVCLVFWLIFGIIGVQIYGGKFFHCVDSDGIRLPIDIVNNYSDCKANENKGYEWKNEAIHFDNIMAAYLALLQVVQQFMLKIVSHSLCEWIITACIFTNTIILAIDHYGASYSEDLDKGNTLRVFKLAKSWKTLNVLITVIFGSLKEMGNLTLIVVIVIYIFAVIGMQLVGHDYLNKLPDPGVPFSTRTVSSESFQSAEDDSNPSRRCPSNYTCLPDVGQNPNNGYTNFDHFGWAFITSFQLITLDHWENTYNLVLRACGLYYVLFFTVVIMFGSYYIINLVLAVVASSYEKESKIKEKKKKENSDALELWKRKEEMKKKISRLNPKDKFRLYGRNMSKGFSMEYIVSWSTDTSNFSAGTHYGEDNGKA
ncbi:Sodium channel protein 60E [Acipenser ruthenus]|uniref:Sodium channel protein n=1 Tax=Acipenser ruthenus TaxID=7906 RepID=A0A444V1Z6_ACIRT|nr:Sodium channel protein 60E [Acipenser ruthenus]